MSKGTRVDISEVTAGFAALADMKESLARTMGVAMGQEVRDEAKIRAPVLKPENRGTDNQRAGLLRDSIYLAYDKRRTAIAGGSYRYVVSWNSQRAPHGHLAEFGHWLTYQYAQTEDGEYYTPKPLVPNSSPGGFFVEAQPFLGPAFDAKVGGLYTIALAAGKARFEELSR
jgi:hypothetical protein